MNFRKYSQPSNTHIFKLLLTTSQTPNNIPLLCVTQRRENLSTFLFAITGRCHRIVGGGTKGGFMM